MEGLPEGVAYRGLESPEKCHCEYVNVGFCNIFLYFQFYLLIWDVQYRIYPFFPQRVRLIL